MRRRVTTILGLLVIGCAAGAALTPPSANAFAGCTQATGYVRDVAGTAIAGARVSAAVDSEYCGRTTVLTDRAGRYSVQIRNTGLNPSTAAVASAAGYASQTQKVYARPLMTDRVGPLSATNDFTLAQ